MANTYTLIASNTLSTSTATVTFSSIAATYTDLVIKASVRCDRSSPNYGDFSVRFNGSTTGFTQKNVFGDGSSTGSSTSTYTGIDSAFATASTFSNLEIYIPNYTSANNKSFSIDNVTENNATEVRTVLSAGLWSNSAAITSIEMLEINSTNFVQYSTFYLYGIKNS